jgi:hypothetical protein
MQTFHKQVFLKIKCVKHGKIKSKWQSHYFVVKQKLGELVPGWLVFWAMFITLL